MGLENRDYYRNSRTDSGRPTGFSSIPQVCKALLIANVAVFLAQIFITRPSTIDDVPARILEYYEQNGEWTPEQREEALEQLLLYQPQTSLVQEWCALDPAKVAQGQIWRIITSAFCHDRFGVWHLLFNMLFLVWFGTRLEEMYGPREFALFYFASAICASFAFLLLHWYTGDMTPAIGASGAVWGVVALYAIHHPYERIYIYFLFPIEIRWLVVLYLILDLHPVLLALNHPQGMGDGVAHAAHLGGALFGFLYFRQSWRLEPLWNRLPMVGKPDPWRPRVVKPDPPPATIKIPDGKPGLDIELEIKLDDVLEKIHREGRESLTDDEQKVLEQASERYRKK